MNIRSLLQRDFGICKTNTQNLYVMIAHGLRIIKNMPYPSEVVLTDLFECLKLLIVINQFKYFKFIIP